MNKVILLYGLPAAGKLTIARKLAEEENTFLIDNHYVHDFIRPFIQRPSGSKEYWSHAAVIHSELLKLIGLYYPKDRPVTYIFTKVIMETERDSEMSKFERLADDICGQFIPIALVPNFETLKLRCTSEERKKRGKMHCTERLIFHFGQEDSLKLLNFPHPNRLVLDNSYMTADETYKQIKTHILKYC